MLFLHRPPQVGRRSTSRKNKTTIQRGRDGRTRWFYCGRHFSFFPINLQRPYQGDLFLFFPTSPKVIINRFDEIKCLVKGLFVDVCNSADWPSHASSASRTPYILFSSSESHLPSRFSNIFAIYGKVSKKSPRQPSGRTSDIKPP